MYAEIIDKTYQGMKARLPFAYINSCYSMIPGFSDLFSVNQLFQAKIKEVEKGEGRRKKGYSLSSDRSITRNRRLLYKSLLSEI